MSRPSEPSGVAKRVVWALLAVTFLAALATAGLFYATGGRWFVIQTPSMGEYAPVGTLVLSTVAGISGLRVGDMILFHPPTAPGETYFHRIVSLAGGAIRTKGDINGTTDPWTLHSPDLIGTETAHVVGLGWLIQALPLLVLGGLILHTLTRYYAIPYLRFPVRVLGWSVLVSLACYLIKPLIRAVPLSQVIADGTATTTVVPTGLLALHAQAVNGTSVDLRPGQPGTVQTSAATGPGVFGIDLTPHLTPALWAMFIVLWLIPLALCTAYALRHPDRDQAPGTGTGPTADGAHHRRTRPRYRGTTGPATRPQPSPGSPREWPSRPGRRPAGTRQHRDG